MPLSLRTLTSKTAAKMIDFGDGNVLNVTYYPAKVSGKMVAYYGAVDSQDKLKAMPHDERLAYLVSPAETLASLVAGWDLTDTADDGTEQPVPVDQAHIESLSSDIQWTILGELLSNDETAADAKSSAPVPADGAASGIPSAPPSDATSSATETTAQ